MSSFSYGLHLEYDVLRNDQYRVELAHSDDQQIAAMTVQPGGSVPMEVHDVGQFIYILRGTGTAIIGGEKGSFKAGSALLIPAGTQHEIVNDGQQLVKFFTVYSPPEEEKWRRGAK